MKPDTICGLASVTALFAQRPNEVQRLFYTEELKTQVGPFCTGLAAAHRPYRMVDAETLEKIAGTGHHGGIAAVARARMIPILDRDNPPRLPFLLILDGIANPHNLGAIARSAAFFGVRGMLIGEAPGNAMPSDAAYRIAEGGFEHLQLFKTRDLPAAIMALTPYYRTIAASFAPDTPTVADLPRDRAVALVLGNEERGVSLDVVFACRRQVRIRGGGKVASLNVAQSAAVLLHALTDFSV